MTAAVDELLVFVAARLDEEGKLASDAAVVAPGRWEIDDQYTSSGWADIRYVGSHGREGGVATERAGDGSVDEWAARRIVCQCPEATLARVEALRALVAYLVPAYMEDVAGLILRRLAAIWAWHPEYQEAWKP